MPAPLPTGWPGRRRGLDRPRVRPGPHPWPHPTLLWVVRARPTRLTAGPRAPAARARAGKRLRRHGFGLLWPRATAAAAFGTRIAEAGAYGRPRPPHGAASFRSRRRAGLLPHALDARALVHPRLGKPGAL